LSPRFTISNAQSFLRNKVGQSARKRYSLAAAAAVAAAGIGVAVSAPWANATSDDAMTGHAGSGSAASHSVAAAAPAHAASANKASSAAAKRAPAVHSKSAPAKAAPAPAKPAPVKPTPAKAAVVKPAPAKAAPVHRARVHVAAPKPYQIYDSVTPNSIPHGPQVATYANGAYAASASTVAGRGHVLWIDTNGSDTHASALDVEPGDATPAGAASWVQDKLNADHKGVAIVYTMISQWQSVKDNVAALPHWMQSHVRYWIADPTGVEHVLPGANATQWYWGNSYDITTANPGFQS